MKNNSETVNLNDRINEAIQKNRKSVFIALGCVAVLLAGLVTGLWLADMFRKKAISQVEELNSRYEKLRFNIKEESSAEDVTNLLADLEAFGKKTSGYSGGRSWFIAGSIHADKEEWAEAETAWRNAAKAGAKTYLAPLVLFNAAGAAEKQGKIQEAIDLYTQSLASTAAFPAAPRAQFSIGRLQEGLKEKDAAIEAYRAVSAKWPEDPVWGKLAQSRVIALETGLGDDQ